MLDLSRYDDVLALLRDHASASPDVRLAIVGGSAATGRYDDHSDLDAELWVDGPPDATYDELHGLLAEQLHVDHVWEVLRERWPDGTRQLFAHLQPDPGDLSRPTRIIDLAIHPLPSAGTVVIDPRRHGTPIVLHDPDGLLRLAPEDEAPHEAARATTVAQIAARRGTAEWLVRRALARGELAEAHAFYLRFTFTPLVELLRIEHCPARHDFGLRYLDTDLPEGYADRLDELLPGPDLGDRATRVFAWTDELLTRLGH
ncbi:nucleotidyltransferase domain-containing protein [Nocardioides sp.]|uniref:nucleotidyltransferase domain-containing protein n=1 Tax=Nocardioides sp. TaxID=35761 RepID=UPI002ED221B2